MRFEFATATRIIFGAGSLQQSGPLAAALGTRALVVGGSTSARLSPVLDLLHAHGLPTTTSNIPGEPTIDMVMDGVQQARAHDCDIVIGMGGGSALDAGKAI